MLPYLYPHERLILALEILSSGEIGSTIPMWYIEFLSDPVEWLVQKDIREIIFIRGGTQRGEENRERPNRLTPPEEGIREFLEPNPNEGEIQEIEGWKNRKNVKIKSDLGRVLCPYWEFVFYNYINKATDIDEFRKELRNMICNYIGKTECDNREFEHAVKNILKEVLTKLSKKKRKQKEKKVQLAHEIKKRYEKIFGRNKLNLTSLVMYHGAIPCWYPDLDEVETTVWPIWGYGKLPTYADISLSGKIWEGNIRGTIEIESWITKRISIWGQLLTGDIEFSSRVLTELEDHYTKLLCYSWNSHYCSTYFNAINLILIPHHGSRENWNSEVLDVFPNANIWVASAGLTNTYGHPSMDVLNEIRENDRIPIWVNELNPLFVNLLVSVPSRPPSFSRLNPQECGQCWNCP